MQIWTLIPGVGMAIGFTNIHQYVQDNRTLSQLVT